MRRWKCVVAIAALLGLCFVPSCTVGLISFVVPQSTTVSSIFEITISAQNIPQSMGGLPSSFSERAGAVVQLPVGFSVESASCGFDTQVYPLTFDEPALLALYTAEPGMQLKGFSGAPGAGVAVGVLRLRIRAPSTPGTHVIKAALAATQSGVFIANAPSGVTDFASIVASPSAKSIDVVSNEVNAPMWQPDTTGLLVAAPIFSSTIVGPFDADVADLDGDGRVDILAGAFFPGFGAAPLPNVHRGVFVEGWAPTFPNPLGPSRSRTGNFNGDGIADIILERRVFTSLIGGGFVTGPLLPTPPTLTNPATTAKRLAVADVDGDGFDDIILSEGQIQVFRSLGNGTFMESSAGLPTMQTMSGVGALIVEDLDGDQDPDIAVGANGVATGSVLEIYLNDGAGNWTPVPPSSLPVTGGTQINGLGAGRVDGDALVDLIVGRKDGGTAGVAGSGFTVYRASAPGVWPAANASIVAPTGIYTSFAIDDLDLDGRMDVIALRSTSSPSSAAFLFGRVQVAHGGVGGTLTLDGALESGLVDGAIHLGERLVYEDVNGDGLNDIVVATNTGLAVYARTGPYHTTLAGNVGAILPGGPIPVLTVNGSPGAVATRSVGVPIGAPFTISLTQTPTTPLASRFIVWGILRAPVASDATVTPVGTFTFVPHILNPSDPSLFTLANAYVANDPLALFPVVTPGPFTYTLTSGVPFPLDVAFEGVIDDPSAPLGIARTNTVLVTVR